MHFQRARGVLRSKVFKIVSRSIAPGETVVVDTSHVTFCDASTITLFLQLQNATARAGSRLDLRNASDFVKRIVALVGLDDLLGGFGREGLDEPAVVVDR